METADRAYLEHDSYLDCSDIKDIQLDKLREEIARDPSQHTQDMGQYDHKGGPF